MKHMIQRYYVADKGTDDCTKIQQTYTTPAIWHIVCGMHIRMVVFVICSCCALSPLLEANSAVIRGRVIDRETAQPLVGATVLLIPRANAVAEDILYSYGRSRATLSQLTGEMEQQEQRAGAIVQRDGSFVINNVKMGDYALTVRYYGYKRHRQEITLKAGETLTLAEVRLALDPQGLEEIVVTGVASRTSKERAEVSVSRVDAAEYMDKRGMAYTDLTQLMAGKIAGVQVAPSSGNVGTGVRFNVRSGGGLSGYGRPVVYVDGVRMLFTAIHDHQNLSAETQGLTERNYGLMTTSTGGQGISTLLSVAPEDIQTIEVLKGPTGAALYGTQASNGAIIITTKRGESVSTGTVQVRVSASRGWNEQVRPYTQEMMLSYNDANSLFRHGSITEYHASLASAWKWGNIYTAFQHRTEEGIIAQNGLRRTTLRVNTDLYPLPELLLKLSGAYSNETVFRPSISSVSAGLSNPIFRGLLEQTFFRGPDSLGRSRSFAVVPRSFWEGIETRTNHEHLTGSVELQWDILKGLTVRALGAVHSLTSKSTRTLPPVPDNLRSLERTLQGSVSSDLHLYRTNAEATVSYRYELPLGIQALSLVGVQVFERFDSTVERVWATSTFRRFYDALEQYREAGIFVNQEFSLHDTYFLSGGVRQDFATSLGRSVPNILYPRVSGAIRVDKLLSQSDINQWSLLKVRSGYGESGVLPLIADVTGTVWSLAHNTFWGGSNSRSPQWAQYNIFSMGNPDLQPERVREWEFGVDVEWQGRYGLEWNMYYQWSNNSIVRSSPFLTPPSDFLGEFEIPTNGGSIVGWGTDLHLYAQPLHTHSETLHLDATLSYANTLIEQLRGTFIMPASRNTINFFSRPFLSDISLANQEGYARETYFSRNVLGAMYSPDGRYAGVRYDTVGSFAEPSIPLVTASFSASLRCFTHLTISCLIEGAFGHVIPNFAKAGLWNPANENNATVRRLVTQLGIARERGTTPLQGVAELTPGTDAYREAAEAFARYDVSRFGFQIHQSSSFFERADFIRLRECAVRYDATAALHHAGFRWLRSLSLGISARNVALWTPYTFPDPEVASDGSLVRARSDYVTLQLPRTILFSFSVGL